MWLAILRPMTKYQFGVSIPMHSILITVRQVSLGPNVTAWPIESSLFTPLRTTHAKPLVFCHVTFAIYWPRVTQKSTGPKPAFTRVSQKRNSLKFWIKDTAKYGMALIWPWFAWTCHIWGADAGSAPGVARTSSPLGILLCLVRNGCGSILCAQLCVSVSLIRRIRLTGLVAAEHIINNERLQQRTGTGTCWPRAGVTAMENMLKRFFWLTSAHFSWKTERQL